MRLIDADALLGALKDNGTYEFKSGSNDVDACILYSEAHALITNAPTIQREGWVSVEDRLPEIDTDVLYHAPIFDPPSKNVWAGKYLGDGVFGGRAGFFGGGEVTHWQPLPLAPTETE